MNEVNNSNNNRPFVGLSFGTFEMAVLTLVFLGIKLSAVPEMPWELVLFPIWFPAACLAVIFLVPLAVLVVAGVVAALGAAGILIWDWVSGLWKGGAK